MSRTTVENFVIKTSVQGAESLDKAGKNVDALNGRVKALAATILGVGFGAFIKNALSAAEATVDLSKATGISINTIKGFESALNVSGGKAADAGKAITTLTGKMYDAVNGNEKAEKAFNRLGISMEDIENLSEQDILQKTVEGLAKLPPGAERSAIATELLGKSFRTVDPEGFARALGEVTSKSAEQELAFQRAAQANADLKMAYDNLTVGAINAISPILGILGQQSISVENTTKAVQVLGIVMAAAFGAKVVASLVALQRAYAGINVVLKAQVALKAAVLSLSGPAGWIALAGAATVAGGAIYALNKVLSDNTEEQEDNNKAVEEGTEAKERSNEASRISQRVIDAENKIIDQYAKNQQNARTQLQKLSDERKQAEQVIASLNRQLQQEGVDVESVNQKLQTAQAEHRRLGQEIDKVIQSGANLKGFDKFYFDIVKGVKDAAEEQEFLVKALQRAEQQLKSGTISLQEYQSIVDQTAQKLKRYQESYENLYDDLIRETDDAINKQRDLDLVLAKLNNNFAAGTISLTQYENGVRRVTEEQRKLNGGTQTYTEYLDSLIKREREATAQKQNAVRAIADLDANWKELNLTAEQYERIRASIFNDNNLRDMEKQTSWAQGFQSELRKVAQEMPTPFIAAERMTRVTFQSMEDGLAKFIRTGKMDFKSFADSIIAEIARIAARAAAVRILGFGMSLFSDESMKKNVKQIGGTRPDGLNVYEYEYKDQYKDIAGYGKQVGFMAQEVEKIYPEAIGRDSKSGKKTIDYSKISGTKLQGFADGGRPPVGETVMVGEEGPELFVPDSPGTIIPNERVKDYLKTNIASLDNITSSQGISNISSIIPNTRELLNELASNQTGLISSMAPKKETSQIIQQTPQVVNVTYTISAVDASSFRQLVAADPDFIYSVTERGRSRRGR